MESPPRRANKSADQQIGYGKLGQAGFTWPKTRLLIVFLAVLNTVLLIVAVVIGINCVRAKDSSSQASHSAATQLISELRDLRGNHSDMLEAVEEAKEELRLTIKNYTQITATTKQLRAVNEAYQKQIETLRVERTSLQKNVSSLEGTCGRCPPNWYFRNSSCYYFSCLISPTVKKNWHESRDYCKSRGGDLAVVDNKKEQDFLSEGIKSFFGSSSSWTKGSWIGITDVVNEGTWVWINNVTETEKRYWMDGEPNNHGLEGEDCVCIIYSSQTPWKTWFDAKCNDHKLHWICEMPPK